MGRVTSHTRRWSGSRSQIPNRIEDGLVEFLRCSPLQSLVEGLAYIGASLPKFDVVLAVGHRVLGGRKPEARLRGMAEENARES